MFDHFFGFQAPATPRSAQTFATINTTTGATQVSAKIIEIPNSEKLISEELINPDIEQLAKALGEDLANNPDYRLNLLAAGNDLRKSIEPPGGGNGGGSPSFIINLDPVKKLVQSLRLLSAVKDIPAGEDFPGDEGDDKKRKSSRGGKPPKPPTPPNILFFFVQDDDKDNDGIPDYLENAIYVSCDNETVGDLIFPVSLKYDNQVSTAWAHFGHDRIGLYSTRSEALDRCGKSIHRVSIKHRAGISQRPHVIESEIAAIIDEYGIYQYFIMQKSNDWGGAGKISTLISYARLKFNIPVEEPVCQSDIDRLDREMKLHAGIADLELDDLRRKAEEIAFHIDGGSILLGSTEQINALLKGCGSRCRISGGKYSNYRTLVFAEAVDRSTEDFEVYMFSKEIARLPVDALPIVAMTAGKTIVIRQESMNFVFANKWLKAFDETNGRETLQDKLRRIALLKGYGASCSSDLNKVRSLFVSDMIEFALSHEIGHAWFLNKELTLEQAGKMQGYNAINALINRQTLVSAIGETVADWCLAANHNIGPLPVIINEKPEIAQRMLLVYMSDNCFMDAENKLTSQAQIDLAIACAYLRKGFTFDLDGMRERQAEIYALLKSRCVDIPEEAARQVADADFRVDNVVHKFDYIHELITKVLATSDSKSPDTIVYRAAYWRNAFLCRFKYDKDSLTRSALYGAVEEEVFKHQLLKLIDPDAGPKYGGRLEEYINDKIGSSET